MSKHLKRISRLSLFSASARLSFTSTKLSYSSSTEYGANQLDSSTQQTASSERLPTRIMDIPAIPSSAAVTSRAQVIMNDEVFFGLTNRVVKDGKELAHYYSFPICSALLFKPVNDFMKAFSKPYEFKDMELHSTIVDHLGVFTNKQAAAQSEEEWNSRILVALNKIFPEGCKLKREDFSYLDKKGFKRNVKTDGMISIHPQPTIRAPVLIFQLKKSSGDPLTQSIAYYVDYVKRLTRSYEPLYKVSLVPCFLLTLNGASLELNCAHYYDEGKERGIHVDLLSSLQIRDTNTAESSDKWIHFFVCLRKAVSELTAAYKAQEMETTNCSKPFFYEIDHLGKIRFGRCLKPGKVYRAIINNKSVIIKIVTGLNGLEVQQALCDSFSGETVAPKLIHVDSSLVFGHHVVVMEHLRGYVDLISYGQDYPGERYEEIASRLKTITDKLHESGFVHGDLRPQNILVNINDGASTNDLVSLIDFDWAGKNGEVRYPIGLNADIQWPEGVVSRGPIKQEHDKDFLHQILDCLKNPHLEPADFIQ